MNRYVKLQNGDIFDNQTKTTLDREKLIEVLTSVRRFDLFEIMVAEVKNELDGDKSSVLD